MTDNTDTEAEPKSAAEAFEELRREVAFMRKVIERMADDQRAAPDYSETLGRMADGLTTASKSLSWLSKRPIVQTTVQEMAQEMSEAGNEARAADKETVADAARALKDTNHELSAWIAVARKGDDQDREVLRFSAVAAAAGAALAIILTISFFRAFPEHGAAWLLGKSCWDAGERLMASADPDRWTALEQLSDQDVKSRQAIADCQKAVALSSHGQRCLLTLKTKNQHPLDRPTYSR
ncbi:DUF6118 family protein [Asticcacaulis sp. ZE23SCel15]|uniref:DUF6118 family protein n=1 Tax=Asticcacaulis sp. ZE23SCel15 TaxID=3059027 RepID=UPI0026600784|nr:DUF6118 family protein [Asticcacaulis sp. ZE23SCel15]WKL57389.1 DUF6118 family protein [Asticcacaulis sp. ZE23SCel15]